ncbi:cytochrome P450 [Croceicoccus sp. BE223]|uniref:cytochrome P450 n=1 Tax=Croceicoccus sp. BE223 TaxID=2817716 RepID=UPI0028627E80|nr:cytochrome P450 [Croceicoccus sp. BE223]MDR7103646.1 cytochrome P450 [Croceicoccus sp. BE223]
MTQAWPLPDIAPERIVDFDFFAVRPKGGDLHAGWKEWQDRHPEPFYTPHNGGHWVATRASQIGEIFRDYDNFSSRGVALFRDAELQFLPGQLDLPIHRDFRRHLDPEVSPARLRAFHDDAQSLAREVIGGVVSSGNECEFQDAIGHVMPIYNFLVFMGLPISDAEILLPPAGKVTRSDDPREFAQGMADILAYIEERLEERRKRPTDDFLGRLLQARIGNRGIAEEEIRATAINVLLGGLDTVTASMGFHMKFLAEHPEHRRALVENPAKIPTAVEELLRRFAIFNTGRLVMRDFDFHGTLFRKDDLVMVPTALYNLDDAVFADALEVDFDRPNKGAHYTFAAGIHRCLGQNFARIQLHIILREWLRLVPDFAIDPARPPEVRSGRSNAVIKLWLRW